MSVKVNDQGKEVFFDVFEDENLDFSLTNKSENVISIEIPISIDSSFKDKEFEVYFLARKNLKESDIFQVFSKASGDRIGWVIPTISLGSDLHDFSENIHFLKYAYIGIRESLRKSKSELFTNCISGELDTVLYSDIFHQETAVLIISKEVSGPDFDIDRATPSLIKNGYLRLGLRNPDEIKYETRLEIDKKIYIEMISDDIKSQSLIAELLNSSFSYEEKSVFKFFYIYQIFELLIDLVYSFEQESIISDLINAKGDSGMTKDALDKMQSFMSEKKRIHLLVNKYSNVQAELFELKRLCNLLLVDLSREKQETFEGYFYKIRNFIFHQYRDFPSQGEEKLDDVIQEVISLMPIILSKFKIPNQDSHE